MLASQHRDTNVGIGQRRCAREQSIGLVPEQHAHRKARTPVEQVHRVHAGLDRRDLITRIAQLPEVFIARRMGLRSRQLFQVSDQERQQVEVKLARAQGMA